MQLRKLLLFILFVGASAFGQVTLTQTTLSAGVDPNPVLQNFVFLTSLTNVNAPVFGSRTVLYIDREAMFVNSIASITNQVTVQRGVLGTAAQAHGNGSFVYVGIENQFYAVDPSGACNVATLAVTPWINILTSTQWICVTGTWTLFNQFAANQSTIIGFPFTSATSYGILSLAGGDNTLFTVPAGKIALVRPFTFNPTAGAITVFPTLTPAGQATIFRTGANVALAASGTNASDTNFQENAYMIGNPGDIFGLNATAPGVNSYGEILLADLNNTAVWKQIILKTFSIGDNTIYTVPAGKVAYVAGYALFTPIGSLGTQCLYSNETGGAVTFSINAVSAGTAVASTNRIFAPTALASASLSVITTLKKMSAGDFLSINSTSNGKQFFTCAVLETAP